jgi:hypothetical protein
MWLEPIWAADRFAEFISRGLFAEHAFWHGDLETAAAEAAAAITGHVEYQGGYGPPVIRVAAVGLSALADLAGQARADGDEERARTAVGAARALVEAAREGAAFRRRPKFVLGAEGCGWLARAEAEWRRADGANDPDAWLAVVEAFGPAFVYEMARSRWRLAEALAEAGRRDEAKQEWRLAFEVAERLGAVPLRAALANRPHRRSRPRRLARRSRRTQDQPRRRPGQARPDRPAHPDPRPSRTRNTRPQPHPHPELNTPASPDFKIIF